MAEDDDDDDFEDLFSFSAESPGVSGGPAAAAAVGGGLPADAAPGVGVGADADEDFADLFGTPPATHASPPPAASRAGRRPIPDDEAVPDGEATSAARRMSPLLDDDDDDRAHDADTKDMLDFLDDDGTDVPAGGPSPDGEISGDGDGDEDEDEFDLMLADSPPGGDGAAEKREDAPRSGGVGPGEEGGRDGDGDGDASAGAAATPAPAVPAPGIEEELAFEQWEDDDHDEDEGEGDPPPADAAAGDAAAASSGGQPREGATATARPPEPAQQFASLSEALRAPAATRETVRALFAAEAFPDGAGEDDRAHLWVKAVCGRTLADVEAGTLADAFRDWEQGEEGRAAARALQEGPVGAALKTLSGGVAEEEQNRLLKLLAFHGRGAATPGSAAELDPLLPPVARAVLRAGVPPAAASVLLARIAPAALPLLGLPPAERRAAARALHADLHLLACYHLPLLAMHLDAQRPGWYWPRQAEGARRGPVAAKESQGGEEPTKGGGSEGADEGSGSEGNKAGNGNEGTKEDTAEEGANKGDDREGSKEVSASDGVESVPEDHGVIPLHWLATLFAGECSDGASRRDPTEERQDQEQLLPVWDRVLTEGDRPWKYFLALALLEKRSEALLMAQGEEVTRELERLAADPHAAFAEEACAGTGHAPPSSEAEAGGGGNGTPAAEWQGAARALMEATPASVLELLRSADDRAVARALAARQARAEEELQERRRAAEAARRRESDERDRAAELVLNRARLVAYYRAHNPERIDTIDQILKTFDGRMGVLNQKLKKKVSACTRSLLRGARRSARARGYSGTPPKMTICPSNGANVAAVSAIFRTVLESVHVISFSCTVHVHQAEVYCSLNVYNCPCALAFKHQWSPQTLLN